MDQNNSLRASFTGKGGEYFVLLLKNFFLTLITLGIYSFWGRVNIQRYIYENISIVGGRFGWHATGKEKFIGFLKAMGVFIVVALIGQFLARINPFLGLILVLAFVALLPAIIVASRRYQLSRTSYNNIRFRFVGRPGKLALVFLKGFFLTLITLYIYAPWFAVEMRKYMSNNTTIGNCNFEYEGKGGELFLIILKGVLLTILTLGIYGSWFMAELQNYHINRTKFQNAYLSSNLSGGTVFMTSFVGYLLTLLTFGIYLPWWIMNLIKISVEAVNLPKAPDLSQLNAQFDHAANPLADGLADAANMLDTIADFLT